MIYALIPAYNEQDSICTVISNCIEYVDKVIVCDDGSTDRTASIAEKCGAEVLKMDINRGKGAAIKKLFAYARESEGNFFVTIDADGQHFPSEIPSLIEPIIQNDADIVVGSRFLNRIETIPLYRRIGNRLLTKLINLSWDKPLSDTQSGFRAYSKESVEKIQVTTDTIGEIDTEILFSAAQNKLRVIERPINCRYEGIRTPTYNPGAYVIRVIIFSLKHLFSNILNSLII